MCGKFTQLSSWSEVHAFSQPLVVKGNGEEVVVSTPMRFANIMRLNAAGERELVPMRWGFAGKDDSNPARPKHMHARGETVDRLPTFAQAFASSRGILMVHTFNEGEELPNGKTKQWVVTPQDGQPISIAVVYDGTTARKRWKPSCKSPRRQTPSSRALQIACPQSCHAKPGRRGWGR